MLQPTFESLFGIPDGHRLLLLRCCEQGGQARSVRWMHEEVDPSGNVTARYETYFEVDQLGRASAGWRRHDLLHGTETRRSCSPGALLMSKAA